MSEFKKYFAFASASAVIGLGASAVNQEISSTAINAKIECHKSSGDQDRVTDCKKDVNGGSDLMIFVLQGFALAGTILAGYRAFEIIAESSAIAAEERVQP